MRSQQLGSLNIDYVDGGFELETDDIRAASIFLDRYDTGSLFEVEHGSHLRGGVEHHYVAALEADAHPVFVVEDGLHLGEGVVEKGRQDELSFETAGVVLHEHHPVFVGLAA